MEARDHALVIGFLIAICKVVHNQLPQIVPCSLRGIRFGIPDLLNFCLQRLPTAKDLPQPCSNELHVLWIVIELCLKLCNLIHERLKIGDVVSLRFQTEKMDKLDMATALTINAIFDGHDDEEDHSVANSPWVTIDGVEVNPLAGVTRGGVELQIAEVEEAVIEKYEEFFCCNRCGKVFWQGSHWGKMKEKVFRLKPPVLKLN